MTPPCRGGRGAARARTERRAGTRAVLIYANCQGEEMQRILARTPALEGWEFKLIPYHMMHLPEQGWAACDAAFMSNVEVVWEQLGSDYPENRARFHELRPQGARLIRFPALTALFLWPFTGADPRVHFDDPLYPSGRYQWADHLAAEIGTARPLPPTEDEMFRRYLRLSAERMPDLDRRLALDADRWRRRDAECEVRIADWLLEHFRDVRLFHTYGRPTAEPLRPLLRELLARSFAPGEVPLARAFAEMDELLRCYTGQDFERVPVHPLVAEHFGLAWWDPDERYRYHANEWTFRDYVINNILDAAHFR